MLKYRQRIQKPCWGLPVRARRNATRPLWGSVSITKGGFMPAKKKSSRKYGAKAQRKISKVMHEYGEGKLRSGRSGHKVTSQKQAVAIGISEARREGDKVPKRRAA